jgi:hypothetical protein
MCSGRPHDRSTRSASCWYENDGRAGGQIRLEGGEAAHDAAREGAGHEKRAARERTAARPPGGQGKPVVDGPDGQHDVNTRQGRLANRRAADTCRTTAFPTSGARRSRPPRR